MRYTPELYQELYEKLVNEIKMSYYNGDVHYVDLMNYIETIEIGIQDEEEL
jgi:hypothetical protein